MAVIVSLKLPLNRVQDTIQTFYDISKKELGDVEMHILGKDREMEMMEENHRVEVRVRHCGASCNCLLTTPCSGLRPKSETLGIRAWQHNAKNHRGDN